MSKPDDHAPLSGLSLVSQSEQDRGAHQLSVDALRTLRQLERRMRTGQLDAVNIRDVQQLAALGLAHHGRGGWRPTPDGLTYLGERHDGGAPEDEMTRPPTFKT